MKKEDVVQNMPVRGYNGRRGKIISTDLTKGPEYVAVEWDDFGDIDAMEVGNLEPIGDTSQLEEQFRQLMDSVGETIKDKVRQAQRLVLEAVQLADEHGIPFFGLVSELGQPYVPYSFADRWSDLDHNFVADLTEVSSSDLGSANGWNNSQVC